MMMMMMMMMFITIHWILKKMEEGFVPAKKLSGVPLSVPVGTRHGAPRERAGAENGQARRGSPKDGRGR